MAVSTILKVFGMTQPELEPTTYLSAVRQTLYHFKYKWNQLLKLSTEQN